MDQIEQHSIVTSGAPFRCSVCGSVFADGGVLLTHLQAHIDGKTVDCLLCTEKFADTASMRAHLFAHLDSSPLYECSQCPRKFSHERLFTDHIQSHDTEQGTEASGLQVENTNSQQTGKLGPSSKRISNRNNVLKCGECKKGFSRKSRLMIHLDTHLIKKPYKCDECSKKFKRRDLLITHHRIHTGEKPYECKECGTKFRQQSHLIYHLRTHTAAKPYKCHECNKKFRQKGNLVRHLRTHTGE